MKFLMSSRLKIFASCLLLSHLASCSKQEEPNLSETTPAQGTYLSLATSLPLEAGGSARAISWKVPKDLMNNLPVVSLNRTQTNRNHPAVIIIRNKPSSGAAKTYYLDANFYREGSNNTLRLGDGNTQEIRLNRDLYNQEIKLNRGDEWYLMAFFKGEWDLAQKTMTYNVNNDSRWMTRQQQQTTGPIDQPLTLPWVKMILRAEDNGKVSFTPEGITPAIKAMGTVLAIKFQNRTPSLRSVRRIQLYSNVLSTGTGYYDLNENNLPAIPSVGAGADDPVWHPQEVANQHFYNSGYKKMANGRDDHTPNPGSNGTDYIYPLIWAMPVANTSGSANQTEIRAEIGWDDPGTTGITRQQVAYETIVWNSSSIPTHNSAIGVWGTITDNDIPGTRKKTRPAGHP